MRSYPMARVDLFAVNDEFAKHRVRTSHFEYRYTAFLASRYDDLESSFNCPPLERRRFLRSTPDAWSKKARLGHIQLAIGLLPLIKEVSLRSSQCTQLRLAQVPRSAR